MAMQPQADTSSQAAAVVTGASSGIGREIARLAARDGFPVLLLGRSAPALAELGDELRSAGAIALTLPLDLGSSGSAQAIDAALAASGLYCDVLVNCAGFGLFGATATLEPAQQMSVLDVNARALTELSLHFLPGMLARRRGGILNVGSIAGYVAGPYMAVYYASKAYVRSFSDALSMELTGTGVTVTCLAPGPVRTEFFERAHAGEARIFKGVPKLDARIVAEEGWRGFKAGRRTVIPGALAKSVAALASITPRWLSLWMTGVLQQPK